MINTARITFLVTFKNTNNKLIFNGDKKSLLETAKEVTNQVWSIDTIKEFDFTKERFKRCSKQRVVDATDFVTEFQEFLKRQGFIK